MAGTTYQELLDGVAAYYGSGSDQWVTIARYGVNAETIPIIEQVPGVSITRSNSGAFLGFDYNNPFAGTGNPASIIDSNVQTGAYGPGSFNAQLPATAVTNPSTGLTTMESGARVTGTGATVAAVADRVSLAVAGVALGTKLGKLIDAGIYSINPDWFDVNFPTVNPETWDNIATTQAGQSVIRSIFGLEDDSATMYLDERMLAYTYMLLREQGAYSDDTTVQPSQDTHEDVTEWANLYYPSGVILSPSTVYYKLGSRSYSETATGTAPIYTVLTRSNDERYLEAIFYCSKEPFSVSGGAGSGTSNICYTSPYLGYDTYYRYGVANWYSNQGTFEGVSSAYVNLVNATEQNFSKTYMKSSMLASLIFSGTISQGGLDGVQDNPQAQIHVDPNLITGTTPEQVLEQLKQYYPDLFNNSVYDDIPQDDGTIKRITYNPVPYPNTTNINQPITQINPGVDPQVTPQVTPQTYPETLTQQLTDSLTGTPTPPDTGTGETPPVVIPPGSASALYSIYNPSQGELNSFGAWLWSSNFVDQLLKLFNDPMQAIIGLHKVFAAPSISGTGNIKVGYLDSGVSSNLVSNQYTTVDCGTVTLNEYFGNVFDYAPFTDVYLYLPFIGIEKLNTGDVMRSSIHVVYHVDVLTGACLAEVNVTRDGAGGTLYTYTGNAAVQYPISSGSYMGIVASLASVAGGVVGTIASGGALAPVAFGAVNGALNAHTRVQHSGGFSGNAGAMGIKTPYLIIIRPQTCMADSFESYDGYPANHTTTLASCSGFTRVNSCHIEGIAATDDELTEIETLLKAGVII